MKYKEILNNIKNKIYHPIYFLAGEEPYFIDLISSAIEKEVLTESEKEFNLSVLYGLDVDVQTIIEQAKRYPMMSNYQVVIVREAQNLKNIDGFERYFNNPAPTTLLVICYKNTKIDKRKKVYKSITNYGIYFESTKLYDSDIPNWITDYLKNLNYSINPKATMLIAENIGAEISKIVNELGKLIINIPQSTIIDEDIVEKNIGISKEYNIFELQDALGTKNIFKANKIIHYFAANNKEFPLPKVLPQLFSFYTKIMIYHQFKDKSDRKGVAASLGINPFFIKQFQVAAQNYNFPKLVSIISYIKEYDLKSKGVNNASSPDGELLKELIFKILH